MGACKYQPLQEPTSDQRRAENREDFMKRWFAIALSVGFATALSRMPWLTEGRIFRPDLPIDWDQVNQGFRLVVAATATLLSWEGYLASIRSKPLTDGRRFYIDVILVTLYLILLLTSSIPYLWIWIHALTFTIYIFWDFLSIKAFPEQYIINDRGVYDARKKIYLGVLRGDPDIYHGPLVTLVWPIYLATTALCYQFLFDLEEKSSPLVTSLFFVFILYGLIGYREDKGNKMRSACGRLTNVLLASLSVFFLSLLFVVIY